MISVIAGLLGWSNVRPGVEFYRWDDKVVPRHGSKYGDLLADQEGVTGMEGSPVICVVLPRSTSVIQMREIEARIKDTLLS